MIKLYQRQLAYLELCLSLQKKACNYFETPILELIFFEFIAAVVVIEKAKALRNQFRVCGISLFYLLRREMALNLKSVKIDVIAL